MVNVPSLDGETIVSSSSVETTTMALGSVFPSTVTFSLVVTLSSSGEVTDSDKIGRLDVSFGVSDGETTSLGIGFWKVVEIFMVFMLEARSPIDNPRKRPTRPAINISFFAVSIVHDYISFDSLVKKDFSM